MEIPEISMISDFEAGVKCLQDPSMVSRFFTLSGIERVPQVYRFWKWGAIILAILATFSSIIKRLKLFLIRFHTVKPSVEPLLQLFSEDFDFSDDDEYDDYDDECSSVSSLEDDEDFEATTSFQDDQQCVDQEFCVAGGDFYAKERLQNGNLRLRRRQTGGQRFSWSDFSTGKSVVKLWDSLGLGFEYEDSCKNVVSMWDFNQNQKISDFFSACFESATVTGLAAQSQSVFLSAEVNGDRNGIALGAYDTRMGRRNPAVYAKWGPSAVAGKVVGINTNDVEKVYVRDDVTGVLTVGDLRNFKAPLETVTESNGDTWWDADAVIVDDERFDGQRLNMVY